MIILPIDPHITDGIAAGRGTTHARQTPASKVIVTEAVRSSAHVLRTPEDVRWTDRYGTTSWERKTYISSPRLTSPVLIGGVTIVYQTSNGSQDIINQRVSLNY